MPSGHGADLLFLELRAKLNSIRSNGVSRNSLFSHQGNLLGLFDTQVGLIFSRALSISL